MISTKARANKSGRVKRQDRWRQEKENSETKNRLMCHQCRYYEATLATDASGDVTKGLEIDKQSAIDRRRTVTTW